MSNKKLNLVKAVRFLVANKDVNRLVSLVYIAKDYNFNFKITADKEFTVNTKNFNVGVEDVRYAYQVDYHKQLILTIDDVIYFTANVIKDLDINEEYLMTEELDIAV